MVLLISSSCPSAFDVSASNRLTIGVLVTTYNAAAQTKRCLDAVLRESEGQVQEIVVVDDSSTPPFEYGNERVRIFRHSKNLGYVESVNRGCAALTTDVVVLLDCDAYVIGDFAATARQLFQNDESLGLAGFTLQDEAGRPTGSAEYEPTVWSLVLGQRLYHRFSELLANRSSRVFFSCAVAIRRECFVQLGGFDSRFDFLDADIDFSMRVNRSRWRARLGEGLHAVHEGGGSPQSSAKRVVRYHTNRYELLKKHGLMGYPGLVQVSVLMRAAVEQVILSIVFLLDRSHRRSQQRQSRRAILRHFLQLRRRRSGCARVKRAELSWFNSISLACIHRACRAVRRIIPRFSIACRVKLRSLPRAFYVRLGTTDYNCFHQVFFQRDYDLPYAIEPRHDVYIIDAGANVGYTSIYYQRRFPNSRIISLEPDHENFQLAKRNLLPYPRCTVLNAALWDRHAEVVPCDGNWGEGGEWGRQVQEARIKNGRDAENCVPALPLVDLFRRFEIPRVTILKMDIEGAEHQVIASCDSEMLSLIENAAIEFHGSDTAAHDWLLENGFQAMTSGETTLFTRA
jgi:FkbM family methyltransferase